jgi:hypothetical protein
LKIALALSAGLQNGGGERQVRFCTCRASQALSSPCGPHSITGCCIRRPGRAEHNHPSSRWRDRALHTDHLTHTRPLISARLGLQHPFSWVCRPAVAWCAPAAAIGRTPPMSRSRDLNPAVPHARYSPQRAPAGVALPQGPTPPI